MRRGLWTKAVLAAALAAAPAAQAQGRPGKAQPVDTTVDSALVAPPEEPGWKVIQFAQGYLRYESDPADNAPPGRVYVVPATPLAAQAPQPPARGDTLAPAEPAPQGGADPCHRERARLAQRLMQLRGIELDPDSALVVLEAEQEPYRPPLALPWPSGSPAGTALAAAASYDTPTKELLAELARCRYPAPRAPPATPSSHPAAPGPDDQGAPIPVTPASASTHSR